MNFFKIGFSLAVGWSCGKAVSAFAEGVLQGLVEDTQWYQEVTTKMEKPKTVESCSDESNVVKNRIGFM